MNSMVLFRYITIKELEQDWTHEYPLFMGKGDVIFGPTTIGSHEPITKENKIC